MFLGKSTKLLIFQAGSGKFLIFCVFENTQAASEDSRDPADLAQSLERGTVQRNNVCQPHVLNRGDRTEREAKLLRDLQDHAAGNPGLPLLDNPGA